MALSFKKKPEIATNNYGDRPSRLSLFWQRQKIILRKGCVLLLILTAIAAAGRFIWSSLPERSLTGLRARIAALDPLQIRHIIISGRHLTDEKDVLDKLGTGINHSLLELSVEDARKRIETIPFIEHSIVERRLPDTVAITLVEKHPIAIWQVDRHFILIDQEGEKVSEQELTAQNSSVFRKLPLVVGVGANIEAGSVLTLLNQYPDINSHMLALIRIGQRRWNILMRNGTTLLLPEGAEAAALARLHDYQTNMQLLDRPLTTIDMRLPDRMVLHAAPADQNNDTSSSASPEQHTAP